MVRCDFRDSFIRERGGPEIGLNVGDKRGGEMCAPSEIKPHFPDHVVVVH
jgi:hypothetical protein